jgi:hypothetical protein
MDRDGYLHTHPVATRTCSYPVAPASTTGDRGEVLAAPCGK